MGSSGNGLIGVIVTGVVLTSAIYLALNHSTGVTTLSGGVANTAKSLGNIARGQ